MSSKRPPFGIFFEDEAAPSGGLMRAVVSKRGVDDGNQKGGGFLQPVQESYYCYNPKKAKSKKRIRISFFHDVANSRSGR
jgi:hypothetical protein